MLINLLVSKYTDLLSLSLLAESGIVCHIDDLCTNHVFYADDLWLMASCGMCNSFTRANRYMF